MLAVFRIIFTALLLWGFGLNASAAQVFKIATLSPEGASWMVKMRLAAEEISKRTNNRVKFKFYPGGVMGNDQSVLQKIRIGQLQGGAVTDGAMSDIYPDMGIYNLPYVFHSIKEVDYVRSRMDKILLKGLEKKGFVAFGLAEGGFAYLMSKESITALADIRKRKVWAPEGDTIARAIHKVTEVSPIPLANSDVLTGLQTGLIDTVSSSPIAAIALQWHTKIKYFTDVPIMYFSAMLAVDKKRFDRLSPGDQKIVREVMGRRFDEIDKQNRKDNQKARDVLEKMGIKFVNFESQEMEKWKAAAAQARTNLQNKNHYSNQTLDTFQKLLTAARK